MSGYALIWRDPVLRLATGLMVMNGTLWASFGPFTALLAVETFALGDAGYAAVLAISTIVGVLAAVWIGIRTDQKAGRRNLALLTCGLAVVGLLMMVIWPKQPVFVLFHAALLPISSTIFGQIFTLARLAAAKHSENERQTATAVIRAAVSLPFVIILPLWGVALDSGVSLMAVYPVSLVFASIMLVLAWLFWPKDNQSGWNDTPSGLSLRAALRELAQPALALRLTALGAIASMPTLYTMTLALILTQIGGRPASQPGLFFGFVAGAEVPSILLMALIARHISRLNLIVIATLLSAVFLLSLPVLAGSPLVWLLILPLAIAHGVLLPMPITYLQDLLANRPGTGTALLALQSLIGNILAALAFWLGTALSGYPLVMILGAGIGVTGAAVLYWADRIK